LSSVVVLKKQAVNEWFRTEEESIENIGMSPYLIENYTNLWKHPKSQSHMGLSSKQLRSFLRMYLGKNDFSEFFIMTPKGKIIISTDSKREGIDKSERPYFIEGKKGAFIQNVYYSLKMSELALTISTPLRDCKGEVIGVLAGRANLRKLSRIMEESTGLGKTGNTYLVNSSNIFVTKPRFGEGYVFKKTVYTEGVKECLKHKSGVGLYRDYRNVPVVGFYSWMGKRGVGLIAEIAQAEAFALIYSFRRVMFLITVGMGIVVVIWGFFLFKGITRPIRELVKGVGLIGRGDLTQRLEIKSYDELEELAGSFNKMVEDLQKTTVSKDYVDNIIKSMADSLIVVSPEGSIKIVNQRTLDLLGYKKAELIGKDVRFLFPEKEEGSPFKKADLGGFIGEDQINSQETIYRTKDGKEIPVLFSGSVIKDLQGNVTDIVCVVRDISDIKKAKDALENKGRELEALNRDLMRNEAALKNSIYAIKKAHTELKNMQRQLVQSEKLASIGQLSAGIAHEINNPLGFVSSNLATFEKYIDRLSEYLRAQEVLKTAVSKGDFNKSSEIISRINDMEKKLGIGYILADIDNLLRESREGLDRIKKIVLDLKTFSHRDEGVRSPVDLNKVIDGVLNIVWNEIKYKAELKKEYGSLPPVNCNSQQIGQVFINILVNAVHSIKKQGVITIRTFYKDGKACVEISDTGGGISPEIRDKIFDPFFTTKKVERGTGLGLSISFNIIKAHKGDIQVESEVGKGATFKICLPA